MLATVLAVTGVGGAVMPATAATDTNPDFILIEEDLEHILKQIQIAESHAAGNDLLCDTQTDTSGKCVTEPHLPHGLRTVDGSFNNLIETEYGAADRPFPKLLPAHWRQADAAPQAGPPSGSTEPCEGENTCYEMWEPGHYVYDAEPRTISNLIVDQTTNNPAAVNAMKNHEGAGATVDEATGKVFIPNTAPDEGLSAPFNAWFTFFGQFFDHGLDLVNKGGNGTLVVPLKPDDPLYDPESHSNFLMLTRATRLPGPDGEVGTADDMHNNQTTPYVDQNQTYTSHPAHQVFLREYELVDHDGDASTPMRPEATGKLLDGTLPDGTRDGLPTWADVKRQAREVLGIALGADSSQEITEENNDYPDVANVPQIAVDPYGNFQPGPNGFPLLVTEEGTVEGDPDAPVSTDNALRTNHAFLDDIAHGATQDPNDLSGYDNVTLDEHFITGDGRGNENIALSAVHHVFHSEHNRMVGQILDTLDKPENAELKKAFQGVENDYQELLGQELPDGPEDDDWSYLQRVFQAAKFATEMQYQHLVFEEFARRIQPEIDAVVLNENSYDATVDAAITAEYAHVVYRFGHSMLTETIDRRLPGRTDVAPVSLLQGFLNPRAYDQNGTLTPDQAAGAIVNGTTDQVAGQIDELVVDTLRNNLLGLPLDLATINILRGRDAGVPPLQTARKTFFDATGDPSLKPYTNWVDFGLNLKNGDNFGRTPEAEPPAEPTDPNAPPAEESMANASLVNFVAAYGKHPSVQDAETTAAKRTAADLLVNGGPEAPADAEAFMNGTGAWANQAGDTVTGLEDVDFWIGGLAEALNPFGGMLGSTFNYVFEKQLEALQFGDRFYYLFRNQGNQLFAALEANSFSSLIKRNTDASLLPADIFSAHEKFIDLEALPAEGPSSPEWPEGLVHMADGTYRWDGDEHIEVHGFRSSDLPGRNDDQIEGGQGDDSLWGYAGRDRIEGRSGNDTIIGGGGDDIITDDFGFDTVKGNWGNDAIRTGSGEDLVLGGHGDDYLRTVHDFQQGIFAGTGDDVVVGGTGRETVFAGEGDDWLEGGPHADLVQGDNADQFQANPHGGNDVVDGGAGNDDIEGEGGDDILIGQHLGTDRMEGVKGYDFVTYRGENHGVDVDLRFTTLQRPDNQAVRDRFDLVEAISGGNGDDVIRGLGAEIDDIPDPNEHKMTQKTFDVIGGLKELLDPGHAQDYSRRFMKQNLGFDTDGQSNLLMGGSGSDMIEGRGGDDFIDGDAYLDAYLTVDGQRYDSARELEDEIFDGTINPGDIDIVREIAEDADQSEVLDTAIYSGESAQYTITDLGDGYWRVTHVPGGGGEAEEAEGKDILRNVELLRFADGCFVMSEGEMEKCADYGTASISYPGDAPAEDVPVTGTVEFDPAAVADPTDIKFRWLATDFEDVAGGQADWLTSEVQDIDKAADCTTTDGVLTCTKKFTPGDPEFDTALRIEVTFKDADGVQRMIISPTTDAAVVGVNDAPVAPTLSTDDPMVGVRISVDGLDDADGLEEAGETLQWQWQAADSPDGPWTTVRTEPWDINGYLPTSDDVGKYLRVQVDYTDDHGTAESVATEPTANPVVDFVPAGPSVVSTTPADAATDVSVATNVEIHFSEPIQGHGGAAVTLTKVADGTEIPFTRGFSAAQDNRLMLYPYGNEGTEVLEPGTEYRVTLNGGPNAIRAADDGTPMETRSFTFTTAAEATAPLSVVSSTPADGATGVDVGSNVAVYFSEPIQGHGGGNVTLTSSDGTEIPFTRGFSAAQGNRLMIYPYGNVSDEVLEPGTSYTVTLTGGPRAIRSLDGVPLESTSITFTTAQVAGAAPTVVSTDPAGGATDVEVTSNVAIHFSEPIQGHGGAAVTLTKVADGAEVPFDRGFTPENDNRLLLNPYGGESQSLEPGTEYQVTLTGGPDAIRAADDGTPFETTSFRFTTAEATTAPTVVETRPTDGATDVAVSDNVEVYFSEPIAAYGGSNVLLTKVSDGTQVDFARGFSEERDNRLLLNPRSDLEPGTEYEVELLGGPTGIQSLGGVPFGGMTFTFTTAGAPDGGSGGQQGTGSGDGTGDGGSSGDQTDGGTGGSNTSDNGTGDSGTGSDNGGDTTNQPAFAIRSSVPAPEAEEAPRRRNVVMRLESDVAGIDEGTVRLVRDNGDRIPATVRYEASSQRVVVDPKRALPAGERIRVVISGLRDAEGRLVPRTSWEFQTLDDVKPRVVKRRPKAKNSVRRGADIRLWIDEKVRGVNHKSVILRKAGGKRVAAKVRYNGHRRIVIDPKRRLARDTRYVVVVKPRVKDLAGNRIKRTVWRIKTVDNVRPRVVKRRPVVRHSVHPGKNLRLWTSEKVRGVNRRSVILRKAGGKRVAAKVGYNGKRHIWINPKRRLARDTRYVVVVRPRVKDTAGNRFKRTVWRFETR